MADFYIKAIRANIENANPVFFGPFGKQAQAQEAIDDASKKSEIEFVTGNDEPSDVDNALCVSIHPKIEARKLGLRSPSLEDNKDTLLGTTLPQTIEELESRMEEIGISTQFDPNQTRRGRKPKEQKEEKTIVDEYISEGVPSDEVLIITKYPGTLDWLKKQGIQGTKVERVNRESVAGKIIIGNIPHRLEIYAHKIGIIEMPKLRMDQWGLALSPDQMDEAGAHIKWYVVRPAN